MGEASALDTAERAAVIRAVVAAASEVPVAVGVSSSARYTSVALARQAAAHGASAIMVAPPPLLRSADALPGFFAAVAEGGELPMIVQDEPAATGVLIPVSVLAECLRAARTDVVKLEDPPTATKISALLARAPGAKVFGGLGGAASYFELRRRRGRHDDRLLLPRGAAPGRTSLATGDRAAAYATFTRYLPLIAFEAQPGIGLGIRKELLRRRGALAHATTRIGDPASAPLRAELDEVLAALHLEPAIKPLVP